MIYFAHSENKNGIKEPVYDHVRETAKLASYYGSFLGIQRNAEAAGWLHDGKNSEIFQEVLLQKKVHVDHSAPGLYFAIKTYKTNGLLIAVAIKGHHDGLDSGHHKAINIIFNDLKAGVKFKNGVEYSVTGDIEIANSYQELFSGQNLLPEELETDWIDLYVSKKYIPLMLYQRMLFSVLVDADYSATSAHFNRKSLEYVYEDDKLINDMLSEQMRRKLNIYREDIIASSIASSKLNEIRNALYEECIKAASKPRGAFTLTSPTGTGKTLALLAFALEHIKYNHNNRIIVVLPYLNLIDQTAEIYRKVFGDDVVYEDHSLVRDKKENDENFYVERWNAPIIITTTVRFFEALFESKAPNCRKLHNIGNSVVLFDEAQTMPPELAVPTIETLAYLCQRFGASVVFSTATQPAFQYVKSYDNELANWNPDEIVTDSAALYDKCRRVNVEWRVNRQTSLDEIAEEASKIEQCCIIVNNKRHATEIFNKMMLFRPDSAFHISTNMCPSHRINVISEIKRRLGHGLPCHVVSTQCIEAGVDLDFPKLYRSIAPLDSIIQAAGRCNRKGNPEMGTVVVFMPEGDCERDYPSSYYHDCTIVLRNMLRKNDGNLDIYSVETIRKYYQNCFRDKDSKKKLIEAIARLDYAETSNQYAWIEERPEISLLVPYEKELALYERLAEEAHTNGIDGKWISEARKISVNVSFNRKANIEGVIEKAMFKRTGRSKQESSDWYILLRNNDTYNQKIGLDFEKGYFTNYAV